LGSCGVDAVCQSVQTRRLNDHSFSDLRVFFLDGVPDNAALAFACLVVYFFELLQTLRIHTDADIFVFYFCPVTIAGIAAAYSAKSAHLNNLNCF
jgi:hypothetical protein